MSKLKDITGQRFGRLVVIQRAPDKIDPSGRHRVEWECKCDCGNIVTIKGENLRRGLSRSCGCLRTEELVNRFTKHSATNTKLYGVWSTMKARCFNPHSKSYERYGGRGIVVCDLWKNSFDEFQKWSFENGYEDGLSIDRIDNNASYCPENCRWVDAKTQGDNRRSNHLVTYNGETRNLTQWAEVLNINPRKLMRRIYDGWTFERAIKTA